MSQQSIIQDAWLGLGDLTELKLDRNPLVDGYAAHKEMPGLHEVSVMTNPEYLHYAAKTLLNIDLLPDQIAVLQELWFRPFPMLVASRGWGKSFMLALYATLKCALIPGTKVVIVGAAFRQSKVIFEYMENIWYNAPVLRSVLGGGPRKETDRCWMKIGNSWAMAIPLGDGSKIRGLRAHIIIGDEFASIPPEIYETVIVGFASVSANPIENVKQSAKRKKSKELGTWSEKQEEIFKAKKGNQAILSGTADYGFKHFADYWRRYTKIIRSKGDVKVLEEIFGGQIPDNLDWKDFSVIRIPYKLIPEGFMDDRQVARAKATMHSGIYAMEYGCCFTSDSDGFFKRSLIEKCVTSEIHPVTLPSGSYWFDAATTGNKNCKYVIGIDPASEKDSFAIVVLELHNDHTRIVYAWSTTRKQFKERVTKGLTSDHDFYGYCARKIRELMSKFPVVEGEVACIGMDAQGGGIAVMEALQDPGKMLKGEIPILPVIDKDKEKDTDHLPGRHILEMVQFARAEWTAAANHGMRKDFEDRVLLFPRFDPVSLEIAAGIEGEQIKKGNFTSLYDSLEDCVMEIEELKNELATIVLTRTGTGVNSRDRWDTPEIKKADGKKGRLRKDRYSALVIANMLARSIHRVIPPTTYDVAGGFADKIRYGAKDGPMYVRGPDWFTKEARGGYGGMAVNRRRGV